MARRLQELIFGKFLPCSLRLGLGNWNISDLRLPNISVLYSILVVEFNQVKNIYVFWTQAASPKRPKRCCFFVECKLKKTTSDLGRFLQALVRGWLTWCSTRQVAFKWWIVKEQTFLRQRWTELFETIELRLFSNSGNIFFASGLCTSRHSKKNPSRISRVLTPRNTKKSPFHAVIFGRQNPLATPALDAQIFSLHTQLNQLMGSLRWGRRDTKSGGKSMGILMLFFCFLPLMNIRNTECLWWGREQVFYWSSDSNREYRWWREVFFICFLCVCVVLEGCK